ncbi:hypothetical protein K502DRAFT_324494 [Neoconidiobolus thromboides FSU 785]|nr:hypothetical protein K502DRAFT_324494 [Neoconidiobolus thromboides FSU 785]
MEKEIYLVIGSEGFLGRHIVNQLIERKKERPEIEIRLFDIEKRLEYTNDIKFFKGDLCSYDAMSEACQGVTTIFQTASPLANAPKAILHKVNVEGMKNVIKVCQDLNIPKLVFSSSCSVVYDGSPIRNMNESFPPVKNHIEDYSHTKYLAEDMVLKANSPTLKTCSLRLSGLFGPGDRQNLPGFLGQLDKGQASICIGDNTNLFDFTYIENAAYAHILASDKLDENDKIAGEAFFITNGTPMPFFNNARKFLTFFGAKNSFYKVLPYYVSFFIAYLVTFFINLLEPIKPIPWKLTPFVVSNATNDRYFDITKARTLLGYEPLYTIEEGLRKSARYFMDERERQGIPKPKDAPVP